MIAIAKKIVSRAAPETWLAMKDLSGRLHTTEADALAFRRLRGTVSAGPFAGMRYLDRASGSVLSAKLLGCYEKELHQALALLIERQPTVVIDIGAAEGYYAVGLARRLPLAEIICFDTDPQARASLAALASLNGVSARIRSEGICSHEVLDSSCRDGALVICDIEGGEAELLDPGRAPGLRNADILVEIHDGPTSRAMENELLGRFSSSHEATFLSQTERTRADFSWAHVFRHPRSKLLAMDERRAKGLRWGVFLRRS